MLYVVIILVEVERALDLMLKNTTDTKCPTPGFGLIETTANALRAIRETSLVCLGRKTTYMELTKPSMRTVLVSEAGHADL